MNRAARLASMMALAWLATAAAASGAAGFNEPVQFNIPAQPLSSALLLFAKQSKLQVLTESEDLDGYETRGVEGTLTSNAALEAILAGTGLSYRKVGQGTVTIRKTKQASTSAAVAVASATGIELALADTSPASGQEVEPQPPSSETVEEVVVTAQKREERLKDVPISITVLSGRDLDKSTAQGITEALNSVPGVAASPHSQTGGTVVSVRGASAASPVFAASSPVSYYLDSVPFGLVQTAIAPDANAYDLERVEVLRGPQGTLYGASAQAGVVRILTKDANLNHFEFKGRGSASSTDGGGENYRGDLAVNVPLVEGKVAARAVLGYEDSSGWIDGPVGQDLNDAELRNARLKINSQPTERLSIGLSAWLSRRDHGGPAASGDNDLTTTTLDMPFSVDYDVYGMNIGYDFSAFSFKSTTSYIDYSTDGSSDLKQLFGGAFSVDLFTTFDAQVFAQEFNLSSRHEGPWRWTAGAIYRDAQDSAVQSVPLIDLIFDWTNTSKSYAVFGEVSRRFRDEKWEWTLGGRYFHDEVVSREDQLLPPINPPDYYNEKESFDSTTPRTVLSWRPSADLSIYGSYSQGFRSGSPQSYPTVAGQPGFPPAKPDKLHNYEIGAKGGAGLFEFDAAVYFMDWEDVQQLLTVPFGVAAVSAIVNGESASGPGVDFGITFRPTDGLALGLDFSWNDLTMDAEILSGGVLLFAKGDRPNYSPERTANVFGEYAFPLGANGFRGRLSASANYMSEQGFRSITAGNVQTLAFGEEILIARAAFAVQAPGNWELTFFGDNIGGEDDPVVGNPFDGPDGSVRVRPRTIGVQLEYRF